MGGSRNYNLSHKISNVIKTSNNHERVRRHMTSREEAINRCLSSLIHTLSCREGDSCSAHGCQKMKSVIKHTKGCTKKNKSPRCTICTQLMSLCFYHSKICRANVCQVPFCRIMKRKLQSLNEHYALKQSIESMKPAHQFPIPPLHLPSSMQHSATQPATQAAAQTAADRRERDISSEPKPKRMRSVDSESDNDSVSGSRHHNNHEAQLLNVNYSEMINFDSFNAQVNPQRAVEESMLIV